MSNKNSIRQGLTNIRTQKNSLNVVITGGSRGLGKSLAQEFSKQGDNVFILSRSQKDIDDVVSYIGNCVKGHACNVCSKHQILNSIEKIKNEFGDIDIWINNAGMSGGSRKLLDLNDHQVEDIILTNLFGTCITTKLVYDIMKQQSSGGAIFNLAGAGSNGGASPNYSVYGATKAAIAQFSKSVQKEWKDDIVDLHVISPGMMLTELLTENIDENTLEIINFICAHPNLVAYNLVPRIKNAYYFKDESYIKFLTALKILSRFVTHKFVK